MTVADLERRAPGNIKFLRANEWGRKLNHALSPERLDDPETYVHHTAGNPYRAWTGAQAMRELQRQSHLKGYATVAYDVVVHRAQTGIISIMEGRGAGRSAATKDRNEEGEAVCLMGFFHPGSSLSERPSDQDVEGLAWAIAWMMEHGWSADDSTILGHRDNPAHPGATACPGDYLYARLGDIRTRVQQIAATTPPQEDDTVFVAYIKHASHNAVYKQWSNGTKTWIKDPDTFAVEAFLRGVTVPQLYTQVKSLPNDAWMRAGGPIVGPIPAGVDGWGCPS